MEEQLSCSKWIICRICLKTSKNEMLPIFGEGAATDLAKQIADYGSITLSESKLCPDRICERCVLLLKAAIKFRKLCQYSALQWQELVSLNVRTPVKENENSKQLLEFINSTNYTKKRIESIPLVEKLLEDLEEQQTVEGVTVYEVIENNGDDCIGSEENVMSSQEEQFIELDENGENDHLPFLEDNSTRNSDGLAHFSNSQFEVLKNEETDAIDGNIVKLTENLEELDNFEEQPKTEGHLSNKIEIVELLVPVVTREHKKNIYPRKISKKRREEKREDFENDHQNKCKNNYVCSYCRNVYNEKAKLTLHLKVHTKEKRHECEICHKRFAQTPQLSRHMNSHTGNRPFQCKYCEASFADPSTCIKHQRIHTQERPYVCDTCGKAFSYSNVLKVHIMSHTGEKPYNCKYCGKKFTQAHHRTAHERTHT